MADKTTVAVIGCGGVAGYAHLPAIKRMENLELVALCDINPAKAREKADRFGGAVFTDYEKMLDELKPQRVHVLTPENVHVDPAVAALQAGADVLVEKPMADTVEACRKLAGVGGKQLVGIDYNYRFIPVMEKAQQVLRDGAIGDLVGITCFCHNFCWHHCLDLVRWLAGPVTSVSATRSGRGPAAADEDVPLRAFPSHHPKVMFADPMVATAQLVHEHGCVTQIATTSQMDLVDMMFTMRLIGTDGWLRIDNVAVEDVVGRLRKFPSSHDARNVPPEIRGQLIEFFPETSGGLSISFDASIRAFHRAADARLDPPANASWGTDIVAIETAARQSAEQSRTVSPSEVQ